MIPAALPHADDMYVFKDNLLQALAAHDPSECHFMAERTARVMSSEFPNCKTWYENERGCGMIPGTKNWASLWHDSMPQTRSFSYQVLQ